MAEDTLRLTLSARINLICIRGHTGVFATQPLAKNVAAETSIFLMGRTFLDIDMQRVADLGGAWRAGRRSASVTFSAAKSRAWARRLAVAR